MMERLQSRTTKTIDVGSVQFEDGQTRYFINELSMGLGPDVVRMIEKFPRLFPGKLKFAFAILITFLYYKRKRMDVQGAGFLHQVYRRAARIEFSHHSLSYQYLKELPLRFEGKIISMKPTRLIWVEQKLLVAVVALSQLAATHTEKMSWALRETGCHLGLIANFYPSRLDVRFLRVS